MKGYLEAVSAERISGWVLDEQEPSRRLRIAIYDGDSCIAVVTADQFRQDLIEIGRGDGCHGFSLNVPKGLFVLPVHAVSAREAETGAPVSGGPKLVVTPQGAGDDAVPDWLDGRVKAVAGAARIAGELEPLAASLANGLSTIMSRQAELRGASDSPVPGEGRVAVDLALLPDYLRDALERLRRNHAPLWAPIHKAPELSIVIGSLGSLGDVHACLESVLADRPAVPCEIILVDGSELPELALAPFLFGPGLRLVRVPRATAATQLWSSGARLARGNAFLFLDETARLQPGAIATLLDSIEVIGELAFVAPRLLSPDGRLLEAGAHLGALGRRTPRGYGAALGEPTYRSLAPTDDVAHCAVMMSRAAYVRFGGFSEREPWGELAMPEAVLRARRHGLGIYTQGCASAVRWSEPRASAKETEAARRVFIARYIDDLAEIERRRGQSRPLAIFIDSMWPDPRRDAGSQVAISHARALQRLGYAVEFSAFEAGSAGADPALPALANGIEAYGPDLFENPLAHLSARRDQAELIYVHRIAAAERILPHARKECPSAKVLFNVADLHFLRLEREADVTGGDAARAQAKGLMVREIAAMQASDYVLTHSGIECDLIRKLAPDARAGVVAWPFRTRTADTPFVRRRNIAFIGGYLHKPNVDAVQHFVASVLPALRERLPDLELMLIGSHIPPELAGLSQPGVKALGYLKDLGKALASLRLTIAPLRYGAGVKGKVLTSLAAGVPCLMSPVAAEGIDLGEPLASLVAGTPEEWLERLMALYTDEAAWTRMAQAGRDLVSRNYSEAAVDRDLAALLAQPTTAPAPETEAAAASEAPAAPEAPPASTQPSVHPEGQKAASQPATG